MAGHMPLTIGRRELIAALGGAAAWPLAARAQQPAMPVVGWLHAGQPAMADRLAAFRQGLNDLGYIEGRNVTVKVRDSDGDLCDINWRRAKSVQRASWSGSPTK